MNNDLPKVFAVPIDKKINNNKDIFLSRDNSIRGEVIDKKDINKIFASKTHVYKTKVQISTYDGVETVEVVGIKNDNLLTLDGKIIPINNIIEIKKV